ncbi:MAG: RNB domain-containing ribonuclease [Acidimicrobiales bacterium]
MPTFALRAPRVFESGFARIRAELEVPARFPDAVLAEADGAADRIGPGGRLDARHLPLVAVDPPGTTDLDQAFWAEATDTGYRVRYAIADVGAFIAPGGAIDIEARRRGTTLYSPDLRTPLHPPILSEGRASLLAGTDKPALLWTIALDDRAAPVDWTVERALVRVDAAISYARAQGAIAGHPGHGVDAELVPLLGLLATIGRLREDREAERGGVSINLPAQEIVEHGTSYGLDFAATLPVEGWNAQISLLTGIVAAHTMADARIGVLRTLPPPDERAVGRLRRTADALSLAWPAEMTYADFVRAMGPNSPATNAFLLQATRTLRGAGYVGFAGVVPERAEHGAIASVYAHVTAPLRRLVDRFGNEILLAVHAGVEPPAWAVEALDELPGLMGQARQRESRLERALLDYAEAVVLEGSVGQRFVGHVVDVDERRGDALIQIADPAIVATVDGEGRSLAERLHLELTVADPATRTIGFEVV